MTAGLTTLAAPMEAWISSLLAALALPEFGLSTVFVIAFISATLLPMGSEPAVFGLVKLNPDLFWPAMRSPPSATRWAAQWTGGWATGNTPDGRSSTATPARMCGRWDGWKTWPESLPAVVAAAVGDPLCAVAGWLQACRSGPAFSTC
jgi:membrane protein YqaA with SNARE-associated domain